MANGERRWTVEWYETAGKVVPMRAFMASLNDKHHEDALAMIEQIARHGNTLRAPHSSLVRDGLYELRRSGGGQVRIFFVFRPGHRVVLLDGVVKKKDKLETRDVDRALRMKRDLEEREGRA
jgi:phage-related protein